MEVLKISFFPCYSSLIAASFKKTWWVNRKDKDGLGLFEGGFLGLGEQSVHRQCDVGQLVILPSIADCFTLFENNRQHRYDYKVLLAVTLKLLTLLLLDF